jgi:hypothetical protein
MRVDILPDHDLDASNHATALPGTLSAANFHQEEHKSASYVSLERCTTLASPYSFQNGDSGSA